MVMLKAVLLFQLVLVVKSQKKVPVQFVTEKYIHSESTEINHFNLRLCGGCLYDHQNANVNFNLPDKPWSPVLSYFLRAYVYDQHNHLIAVNKDTAGNFIESFTFPYYKTYGDLHIEVTTAQVTGGINYNVVVKFEKNATMERNKPSCQPRYVSSTSEVMNWEAYKRNVHMELAMIGNTYDLVSIFKTTKPGTVPTHGSVLLELDYCFNPAELPGYVEISVFANNELSGFGTYACPGSVRPCTTESTKFYDVSGAAVNFVHVDMTQAKDMGPVQVIIVGNGRSGGINNFTLGASRYSKHT
ncbi:uncharacterized protein LOC130656246 [Hydractinia symbiolongicarpus]|uniref:uncharacterized protein LOC130656246 n=1 Tax=Hydractinia symbiolongicarpus TaxID=13093 RepID=UPI00254E91FE|nr:uncharacterized protein LOC130656246 [Hydractinia symbiolongicarpus]